MLIANTHTDILFFTNSGRVYKIRGYKIPEYSRQSKGLPIINLLKMDKSEKVRAMISIDGKDISGNEQLLFVSTQGISKRVSIEEFKNIRQNGKIAVTLKENDELYTVKKTSGEEEILIENIIPQKNSKENQTTIGIGFFAEKVHSKTYSFFPAIINGFVEAGKSTALTFKSLALLFQGIDLTKAVSGPLRITVMLGDTAKAGFSAGFSVGIVTVLNFLAIISISLFIMNLLPIPILDGGLILFALIEAITKKQISPRIQYYIQFIGVTFILILFIFAMFGDISYIINLFK
jgi:RIP metalloprotease RseP